MLHLTRSRFAEVLEYPLADGVSSVREGQVLVADYTDGELRVRPSRGTAADLFVGFAYSARTSVDNLPAVEELTVDPGAAVGAGNDKTVRLQNTPVANSIAGRIGAATLSEGGGIDAAGEFSVSDNVMTIAGESFTANTPVTLRVTYRYIPTVAEVRQLQGDVDPGTHVSTYLESVGVVTKGLVFTSEWKTSDLWLDTSTQVYAGSNGEVTLASTAGVDGQIGGRGGSIITKYPHHDGTDNDYFATIGILF